MASNPTLITTPFAQNGDKTTPPNTNTPSDGKFSQSLGFPPITSLPLTSGGKAPDRLDFNGAFNMLSNIAFYAQKGWQFQWDSTQAYFEGCVVRYSGNIYECISDVGTGGNAPSSDTTHWRKYNITPGTEYAPINSPAFTGTPTAPTPSSGDNSTKIATTAFVKSAISGGSSITDTYYNSSTGDWYRVYADGWVEQGGIQEYSADYGTGGYIINLLKPMADTNYTCMRTNGVRSTTIGNSQAIADEFTGVSSLTTTSFVLRLSSSTGWLMHSAAWLVFGKGATS